MDIGRPQIWRGTQVFFQWYFVLVPAVDAGGFRCPFRVSREVLLVVRLGQRPQVGRATLLSALVKAYKPYHHRGRMKIRPCFFSTTEAH